MQIRNIRIRYRLALGFGIILLLSGLIGVVSNSSINEMWQNSVMMYDHPFIVSKSVRDIRTNIVAMHRSMKDVALALNETQMDEAVVKVNENERKVYRSFEIVFDKFLGNMNDVQVAYDAFASWKPIRDEVIQLWYEGKREDAAAITTGKGADHVDKLNRKIQIMIDFANEKGDSFFAEARMLKTKTQNRYLLIFLIIVIIGLFISAYITYSITKPLSRMLAVSSRLSKGELSARNIIINEDETGRLALSINNLASSIETRNIIQKGVAGISETMIGPSSMLEFGSQLLKQLMETTKATMSAFYVLNEDTSEYEHFASIGANEELLKSFNASNPSGEIGNAISVKKIYYINNIPENTIFKYNTISGVVIPKEIITIPIVVEDVVIAVISLVNINKFSQECSEILEQSWSAINTSYSNLLVGEKTRIFADQLTYSNQQLEAQAVEMDQTEKLQYQAKELQRTTEELQEQNLKLSEQREQVEVANNLKSEFLSNMSHELRTPLNSIMALSRVLILQASEKLTDEEKGYLNIVERNGKHLLALINDILDLSKIEAGKMEVTTSSISAYSIVQMVTESMEGLAIEKGISINLNAKDNLPNIETDSTKLHQALLNIIGNAVKFTEEGSIDIYVDQSDEDITICVKDSGIGISEEMLPHIFDEFRQVDGTSSRKFEGTGLGLAIASKLISILGGSISVQSEFNVGSTFTISIPIFWNSTRSIIDNKNIEKVPDTSKKYNFEKINVGTKSISESTILIVEDNKEAIIQLHTILAKEGYQLSVASNGKEALEFISHTIPDGIILDLMMPEIDGFEVLNKLRATDSTRNIPVLVLTAKDLNKNDLSRLKANNIQQLIQKGDIDIPGLLKKIRIMLGLEQNLAARSKGKNKPTEVLVIEDNPDNMVTINAILGAKYKITEAVNGEQGLLNAQSKIYDIILLDMSLPNISGEEIIKILKEDVETRSIPVIAVTAQAMKGDKEKFINAGCDGYVSKPVNPEALFSEINRLLNT